MDLRITEKAQKHVRKTIETWPGDYRDLALALTAAGNAIMLVLDGRTDQIEIYEAAALAVVQAGRGPKLHG